MRQQEKRQKGRENTQARRDPEGVLRSLHFVVAPEVFDVREDSSADECANLSHSRSNTVILATDTSGAGFGGNKTNVITRSHLTKREENAIDDSERGDMTGPGESIVAACHDVADDGLEGNTNR